MQLPVVPPPVPQFGGFGFFGIGLEGWLTLAAVLAGPIIALWLQRISERRREIQRRKLTIFRELMATRATRLSMRHVEALNAIEIEFNTGKSADKRVFDQWRLYLNHFEKSPAVGPALAAWAQEANKILVELLFEMSSALGYKYDKVSLEKSVYYPKGHGELEDDQTKFRKYFIELMEGKRPLWTGVFTGAKPLAMQVVPPPPPATTVIAAPTTPKVPQLPSDQ